MYKLIATAISTVFLTACSAGSEVKSAVIQPEPKQPKYTLEEIRKHWNVPLMP